jgi:hypothetical protein
MPPVHNDLSPHVRGRQVSTAKACTKLDELREIAEDFDVIGIDEGQFVSDFSPALSFSPS